MTQRTRKNISFVLMVTMLFSLLLPMGAFADPSEELVTPTFGSDGEVFHTAEIQFSGDVPITAAAHFYYYDNDVRHEGKDNEPLSIYEGCDARIYVKPIPGYEVTVKYPDIPVEGNFVSSGSMEFFNKYFHLPEGFFTMPAQDLKVNVIYKKVSKEVTVHYVKTNATGIYAPFKVPVNSEITLPQGPVGENGNAFGGWLTRNGILQPGEKYIIDEYSNEIVALYFPKSKTIPEYLDLAFANFWFEETYSKYALRIAANEKLPAGKRIKSITINFYPDPEGHPESFESASYEENYDGLYVDINMMVTNLDQFGLEIVTELTDDPGKDVVIDLSGGIADLSKLPGGSAMAPAFVKQFERATQYDTTKLYMNRLGSDTSRLYAAGADLNHDGYLDIRTGDVTNSTSYFAQFLKFNNQMLRCHDADKCDQACYVYDSGLKEAGKLIIKLFDSFKVKFVDGNTVLAEEEVIVDRMATAPKVPAKEGYTFKGWKIASGSSSGLKVGDLYDLSKPVTGDLTLTAVWEKNEVGAAVGTKLSDGNSKAEYTVTKQGDGTNPPEVSYDMPKKSQGKKKTVKVPDSITVGGVSYRVTSVIASALSGEKKATTIELGEYIDSIPNGSLKGCKKLKTLKIKNKTKMIKLTKKTFKGLKGKIKLLVPKAFFKGYKKQIKKLKLTKKVKVKKY